MSDATKDKVIHALIDTLRLAPGVEDVMGREAIESFAESKYATIFNGEALDFAPVRAWLLEAGVKDEQAYPAMKRLEARLSRRKLGVIEPEFPFDEPTKERLVTQTRELTAFIVRDGDALETDAGPAKAKVHAESEYAPPKESSNGRLIALLALMILLIVGAAFSLKGSSVDVSRYQAIFPIKSGEIQQGKLKGLMDMDRWQAMDEKKQQAAVQALETQLKADKLFEGGVILQDEHRHWVVFSQKGEALRIEKPH